jgi:BMFP domain-containing protein YqiC
LERLISLIRPDSNKRPRVLECGLLGPGREVDGQFGLFVEKVQNMAGPTTESLNTQLIDLNKKLDEGLKKLTDDLHSSSLRSKDEESRLRGEIESRSRGVEKTVDEITTRISVEIKGEVKSVRDDVSELSDKLHSSKLESKDDASRLRGEIELRSRGIENTVADITTRLSAEIKDEVKSVRDDISKDIRRLEDLLIDFKTKDLRRLELSLADFKTQFKDEVHLAADHIAEKILQIDVERAELKTRVNFSINVAIWGLSLTIATLIGGVTSGIWWASKTNTTVEGLDSRTKSLESRSDSVGSKILEQTKPK